MTTDFGASDAYVAAVKGVILTINPEVTIVDLSHSIEPQNIYQAAFVLSAAYSYFPAGTIHLVVVDPGVGTRRKLIILVAPSALFVAPDNGVLSHIIHEYSHQKTRPRFECSIEVKKKKLPPPLEAITITNPRFWHQPVSGTFHGRDVLAPVAAHLSLGVSPEEFGDSLSRLQIFPVPRPYTQTRGELVGHILHIDHFGNLISDVKKEDLVSKDFAIEVAGKYICGLSASYEEGAELLAIFGSSGYLEVAARGKNAALMLGAKVGDPIKIRAMAVS